MGDRRRGDIVKCHPFQPPIHDHDNYASYLWLKAYQGYFVLRQRFVEHHPCEWRVIREVEVDDPGPDFFDEAEARFLEEFTRSGPGIPGWRGDAHEAAGALEAAGADEPAGVSEDEV